MAGYNRVIMVGNLTRDPEIKQLPSGMSVCRLSIASNRQFKNRQTGAMVQDVCYIDIDVWGGQAESCNKYLQKGRPVLVEGRIKFDSWQDAEGKTRSKHSLVADNVQFLGSGQDQAGDAAVEAAPAPRARRQQAAPAPAPAAVSNKQLDASPFDDDLPF